MKSTTQIQTLEGRRIAKRLFNHWKHKFEVLETEQDFKIIMPTAIITLIPQPETLDVSIKSDDENHDRLEQVVIDHLNRMAQQEFTVTWHHPS